MKRLAALCLGLLLLAGVQQQVPVLAGAFS